MTTPSLSKPRRIEGVCPPWCMGHDEDGFQGWERLSDETRTLVRGHDGVTAEVGGVSMSVGQLETLGVEGTSMAPARVRVYTEVHEECELTTGEVQVLITLLASCAEQIEVRK